jgi:hypothetical protein
MDYTENIKNDFDCNYINLNHKNSSQILLSCVNNPNKEYDCPIKRGSINIEGFSSDMSSSGVYYVPKGMCPDGYEKEDNKCIQKAMGVIRNGDWQRSHHHGEITHNQTNQNNFNVCGDGSIFKGIDSNGYISCEMGDKKNNINTVEDNDDDENLFFSAIL